MSEQHKRTNIGGKLLSSYPAVVIETKHPDGLYLAKVRLLGLWDTLSVDVLPWAEFMLPLGAKPEAGHAVPVEADNQVWVDFPRSGDTRYPRITGAVYQAPNMVSNLPSEITGKGYEQKRADGEPKPPLYSDKDDIYKRFGFMEHKTHSGGYCITHLGTGSAIEITDKGQIIIHCEAEAYRSSKNLLEQVAEAFTIKVGGNANIEAKGDATLKAGGKCSVDGSKLLLKSAGDVSIEAGGNFNVKAVMADFKLG